MEKRARNLHLIRVRNGTNRLLQHRVHVPLPMFVLKIVLLIGLAGLSAVFIVSNVMLTKKLEWKPPPMILVPGLLGSKLYIEGFDVEYPAQLNGKNCSSNIPLRKSWVSNQLEQNPDCELYLLSLTFDQATRKFRNRPNLQVTANLRGVPFGSSLWPVQCTYTDEVPLHCDYSTINGLDENYFRRFAEFLTAKLKYQQGKSLFAAQYDWRHHQQSDAMNNYYGDLKFLVEHAVNMTKKKAVLLGHSMGNMVINRFLRDKVTPEWQKAYLSATINVAAPYGGAVKMIKPLVAAEPMQMPNNHSIPGDLLRETIRSWGSTANLLPFKNAFGSENVLLKIGNNEFTGSQMSQFLNFLDVNAHLVEFYSQNEPTPQPHIPMYCVYSVGPKNTPLKLTFNSVADNQPETMMGDGDGTVNVESLRVCQQWREQGHPVHVKEFPDLLHTEILMNNEFYAHIADVIISL